MLKIGTPLALLLCALLLGPAGCSDNSEETPAKPQVKKELDESSAASAGKTAVATNSVADIYAFPGATPAENAHIRACLDAIDSGRDAFAVRHAREFMDSTNTEIRLQAVAAFGWIGKIAIKELAEMMSDPDETVASEALRQWEMAFDEYSSEAAKMWEIERAAGLLKDQSALDAVMMKLSDLEDCNSVKVLCNIITSTNSTPIAVEVAREEYVSLAGEPFLDAKRAEQVAKTLKDRAEGVSAEQPKNKDQSDLQKKGTK